MNFAMLKGLSVRALGTFPAVLLIVLLAAPPAVGSVDPGDVGDPLSYELRKALTAPLRAKIEELVKTKNEQGIKNKRGTHSRDFRKVDDNTYKVAFHVDTADELALTTERLEITLKKDPNDPKGKRWMIADEKVMDTYSGLYREGLEGRCYPFESFSWDREGLKMTASNGTVCTSTFNGEVASGQNDLPSEIPSNFLAIAIISDDLAYDYTPPNYLDYVQVHRINLDDYRDQLLFKPYVFEFACDPITCEEILLTAFTGLDWQPPALESAETAPEKVPANIHPRMRDYIDRVARDAEKERRESAFAHFRRPDQPGHRYYIVRVPKENKDGTSSIGIIYDNWGGFEVVFWVEMDFLNVRAPLSAPRHGFVPVYGYYTDETLKSFSPYELEEREDRWSRWHQLYSLKGDIKMSLDVDPEMLSADIRYGVHVKQDINELPFVMFIADIQGEDPDPLEPKLWVNSVQMDGQELTWVRTGPYSGLITFPEQVPGGSKINIRMMFTSIAIKKINPAYSRVLRGGWMPLHRTFDMIDEFELTISAPAQYTILGIGKKIWEKRKGDVKTSHWVSEAPVEFPSIIFGKYQSDKPTIEATKLDGTPIPVAVHVDEVSMMALKDAATTVLSDAEKGELDRSDIDTYIDQIEAVREFQQGARGIRGKQLRPIAEQAAFAINYYKEISGLDYPYGELNLVNDPEILRYGQAPSSLIYLGSFVFRGEGAMAGESMFGGRGRSGAKFLKSVVAHEVGHQWWGSRVCNSNDRNYWFVESLAEYFSALYLEAVFGPKEYQEQVDDWRRYILERDQRTSVQNASALFQGTDGSASYVAAVYNRGPYAFHMLRETFGDERFFPFLKKFTQNLAKKKEIVTRDIQMVAEEALGGVDENGNPYKVDLEWFFDQWIRGVGIPEYRFVYDVRETEDGGAVVEGTIYQRVVAGNKYKNIVMEDTYYRGVVPITVIGKQQNYEKKWLVEGPETTFRLKVPERPLEVVLNKDGESLAHDVVVNKSWKGGSGSP